MPTGIRSDIAPRRARDCVLERAIEFSHGSVKRAVIAAVSREQHYDLESLLGEASRLLDRKRRQGRSTQCHCPKEILVLVGAADG